MILARRGTWTNSTRRSQDHYNILRSALDPKVSAAVRSNFSREKFKGKYEAERSDLIPFEDICIFLKKTYDRPGRLVHALLEYLTLGKGIVRDLITTRTNKLGILSRLGAKALPKDRDRALILRALSAPWILGGSARGSQRRGLQGGYTRKGAGADRPGCRPPR
jgi:hypothetical protein